MPQTRPIVSDAVVMISLLLRFLRSMPAGPRLLGYLSFLRLRDEQIHSKSLRQEFRDKLSLYAIAGFVERRREGSEVHLCPVIR